MVSRCFQALIYLGLTTQQETQKQSAEPLLLHSGLGRLVGTRKAVPGAEEEWRGRICAVAASTQRGHQRCIRRPLLEARPAARRAFRESLLAENSGVLVSLWGNSAKMLTLIQKLSMGAEALHLSPVPS